MMFWRSVVGKLWFTILLLVSFVLFILTVLLLEFFENFFVIDAEDELLQNAEQIAKVVEDYGENDELVFFVTERILDPNSRAFIVFEDSTWMSSSEAKKIPAISTAFLNKDKELRRVMEESTSVKKLATLPDSTNEVIIVGTSLPNQDGAVYVYQPLTIVEKTTSETTKIIFLSAGIAIVLTTIFAFFLSTRITSPLIKMREAAFELARGEFNTKVPILTHDEIGELAMAFNRMGRQLKFHINALRQEKEQLSGILRSMADGVITLSRKGEMLVTNPPATAFLESWYFEKGKIADQENNVLPMELKDILKQVITTEKEVMAEFAFQGRNWVIIMTPLYDQSYVRGAVAVIRDMSEERRLDKLRKDFIANVSHELRTPISMLQGYSEAIMDDIAESKEEKNELAAIIHDESLRIGRLVNELLDLARMEAGHIQLNINQVDLRTFCDRIIRKFQGLAKEQNIQLKFDFSNDLSSLNVDPDRLEQVLTNLIDNAIRHTNENGDVHLIVQKQSNGVQFSVKDSGSGISEEDLPFVFERFYKADKSRSRGKGKTGTGLGLAIVKNIVEAHNGTISVHSKLQEGTTFTFFIPNYLEIAS
ncbi:ATP-binding protein [Bacillaceae bacterium S4-13-58]